MNPAVQQFPRQALPQTQECQECVELRQQRDAAIGNYLRLRAHFAAMVARFTHAVHRDAGDLYDKRADKHDKPTWTYLTQGRPAGRQGDAK